MPADDFATRVKALALARKTSVAQVGFAAHDPKVRGTNPDTFKSVMAGRRKPTAVLIEAVARALKVPPDEFSEYRLALARQMLDEREVGLDQALATLTRFETALQTDEPVAPREEPPGSSSRRRAQGGEP